MGDRAVRSVKILFATVCAMGSFCAAATQLCEESRAFIENVVPVTPYRMALNTCQNMCIDYDEYVEQGCPVDEKACFTDLVVQRLGKLCDVVDQIIVGKYLQSSAELEHLISVISGMREAFRNYLPIEPLMIESVIRLVDKMVHNLTLLHV